MAEPMTVDLSDPDFWQDPYPTWQEARRHGRTARTARGEPIVLAADDVDVLSTEPGARNWVSTRCVVSGSPTGLSTIGEDSRSPRTTVRCTIVCGRSSVARSRRGASSVCDPSSTTRARGILDAAAVTGHVDVVADYAHDLPLWLLCQFLGLPLEDYTDIATFLVGTEEGFAEPMTPERRARAEGGIVALYSYVGGLVNDRLAHPREDLISDLVQSEREGRLDCAELLALVVNVIGGAVGSTRAAIANSVYLLLAHRDQAAWVRTA